MVRGNRTSQTEDIKRLQERVEHLERINRWHMASLEMLGTMGYIHGDARENRDPANIFAFVRDYIERIIDCQVSAFFTVNEEDASFELADCAPRDAASMLQHEYAYLIDSGKFAWALNQNRAVEVESSDGRNHLLLHVLASRSRVRGMFIAVLEGGQKRPSLGSQHLLSIVLHHCAYALESAALYALIKEHTENIQNVLIERTLELERQYGHDELTGLPNRILFIDRIGQAIKRAERAGNQVAVLLIDLDMFKRINDILGPGAGDRLLLDTASKLKAVCESQAEQRYSENEEMEITISRLGGDEFGVLVSEINSVEPVVHIIKNIVEKLASVIDIEGHAISITSSIGVALYPTDGTDAETLLKHADAAMYHAKRLGRDNYQFYSSEITTTSFQQLLLENQLRNAVQRDELLLYYQPKIDIASGRINGMEALIRWDNPERGILTPDEFIPIAEYSGMIIAIGEWVLRSACRQAKAWLDAGHAGLQVAVNLSARQFLQVDLHETIIRILDETALPPSCLELEITESMIMEDIQAAVATMRRLHDIGVSVSIDDFGTGYSSLSYLKRFPIDALKVDRSFIRDIMNDPDDAAIVTAIVAMARGMGLQVVAEGVETEAQFEFLRQLRCDSAQGFLFSRPVPVAEADRLLRTLEN